MLSPACLWRVGCVTAGVPRHQGSLYPQGLVTPLPEAAWRGWRQEQPSGKCQQMAQGRSVSPGAASRVQPAAVVSQPCLSKITGKVMCTWKPICYFLPMNLASFNSAGCGTKYSCKQMQQKYRCRSTHDTQLVRGDSAFLFPPHENVANRVSGESHVYLTILLRERSWRDEGPGAMENSCLGP